MQQQVRGRGPRLTDLQRIELLDLARNDPPLTNSELSRRFKISRSAVIKLRSNESAVRKRFAETKDESQRNKRQRGSCLNPVQSDFEEMLYAWMCTDQDAKTMPKNAIQHRAKAMAETMGGEMINFKASNSWYQRFCKRYNITGNDVRVNNISICASL